ncbi:hypothetical protein E3983_08315 [Legionella israelensis]|uniref:Uncharacterized protein n=1 Tax=Legionella israelensis TaxID=454 RepID=A0AAX1EGY4_9GAMM|nr:hypothetical protein [Legionella israelensis]QBR84365.1 hypothetical protein E3983_08315 [Legionella israelensis]
MRTTTWKLNNYLLALKQVSKKDTIRPFDKHSHVQVELGHEANHLSLPELSPEQYIPPSLKIINQFYQILQPVLLELEETDEFDWDAGYGNLSAKDIAKAYLYSAFNNIIQKKELSAIKKKMDYQEFFHDLCDALVEGKSAEEVLEHVAHRHYISKTFDILIDSLSIDYPSKAALIVYFKNKQLFNMAYKTSLFEAEDIEQALTLRLQKVLLNAIHYVKLRKSLKKNDICPLPDKNIIETTNDLTKILDYYDSLMDVLLKLDSESIKRNVINEIGASAFFKKLIPDEWNSSSKSVISCIKNIQLAIESANKHLLSQHKRKLWLVHYEKSQEKPKNI